jgi:hypothetical protein
MKQPLCGNKTEHDYWVSQLFTCPLCARIRQDRAAKQAQSEFANMVAERVVSLLKEGNK